jgi:hypothetical protein
MPGYDPSLRQKAAAQYLGVSDRTFRDYVIEPDYLPGRAGKRIAVYPVSRLNKFREDANDPKSRRVLRKERKTA